MEEMPNAPSARDMKGNQYTGKELVLMEGSETPPPTLASVGIDKNLATTEEVNVYRSISPRGS